MKEDRSSLGIRPESFQVLTEKEINNIIDIGVIYRPTSYSILLIKEGTIHFRHMERVGAKVGRSTSGQDYWMGIMPTL